MGTAKEQAEFELRRQAEIDASLRANALAVVDPYSPSTPLVRGASILRAAPAPLPDPAAEMVPVFNSMGDQIGTKPKVDPNPLFMNPFADPPVKLRQPVSQEFGPGVPLDAAAPGEIGPPVAPGKAAAPAAASGGSGASAPAAKFGRFGLTPEEEAKLITDPNEERIASRQNAADVGAQGAEDLGKMGVGQTLWLDADARNRALNQKYALQEEAKQAKLVDDESKRARNMHIEPANFWQTRNAGQKVAATMAIVFGGMLQGIHGGQNSGFAMINKFIDDDIDAQKANIAQANGRADDMKGTYARLVASNMHQDQALEQARALGKEAFISAIAAKASAQKSPEIKAAARIMIGDLRAAQAKDEAAALALSRRPTGLGAGAGGPTGKELRSSTHQFADDLEKDNIPENMAILNAADQNLDTLGSGDIPGVSAGYDMLPGPIQGIARKIIGGDEAVANAQTVAAIKNPVRHAISGANLSPQEKEYLSAELDGAHDAASIRRVVHMFRAKVAKRLENRIGGAGPTVVQTYKDQGGTVPSALPLNQTSTPALR